MPNEITYEITYKRNGETFPLPAGIQSEGWGLWIGCMRFGWWQARKIRKWALKP